MKNRLVTLSPRAALFIGAALLSTPAWAQDTQVTPPPVVTTVPAPAPAPAPAPVITIAPASPVVQSVPEPAAEAPARAAPRAAARRPATSTTTTTTRRVTRTTTPAPAPAPVAEAPVAEAPPPAPVTEAVPAPEAVAPIETQTTDIATTETTAPAQSPTPIWPWLLVGALIVAGAVAALLFRRRREDEDVYVEPYEPVAVAPVVAREPVAERVYRPKPEPEVARPAVVAAAAAPLMGDTIEEEPNLDYAEPTAEAELHAAEKEDLAGLTAKAPVSQRPWLEFGMRPVRAGTSADEALVEIELTVGNAGDVPAKDVRISTFMLADGDASDMENLLIERGDDATVPPVTIKPGEGTRVDATLAVRKDTLSEHEFSPVVVADARYTMADGTEGRTSATFRVGLWTDEAKLEPILFDRPEMHREVAAELVGKPAHA